MTDFSFLAVPNIEGMRVLRYIKIFGIVLLFGVCLFFVLYFWSKYRTGKKLFKQLDSFDQRAHVLEQELILQKIQKSSGKTKLVLFIEYLERFVTNKSTGAWPVQAYANIAELLISQWCTHKEAEEFSEVLYADKKLSQHLEIKLQSMIDTF